MNFIRLCTVLFFLSMSGVICSMYTPLPHDSKSGSATAKVSALTNIDENHIKNTIIERIKKVPSGGYIGVDNQYLLDRDVVYALIGARQLGVRIVINLSEESNRIDSDHLEKLLNEGVVIKKVKDLHIKRVIMADADPDKVALEDHGTLKNVSVFLGSYNLSGNAKNNTEFMTLVSDDFRYFFDNYNDHKLISNKRSFLNKGRPMRDKSPERIQAFSSQLYDLSGTKRKHIERLTADIETISPWSDDMLDITTMTFDDIAIASSIEVVRSENSDLPVRLFIEEKKIKDWHRETLDRLYNTGVLIYTFNKKQLPDFSELSNPLMHVKTILRRKQGKESVIISTGNLTKHGNDQINSDAYHPDDHALFVKVKAINEYLAAQGKLYQPQSSALPASSVCQE